MSDIRFSDASFKYCTQFLAKIYIYHLFVKLGHEFCYGNHHLKKRNLFLQALKICHPNCDIHFKKLSKILAKSLIAIPIDVLHSLHLPLLLYFSVCPFHCRADEEIKEVTSPSIFVNTADEKISGGAVSVTATTSKSTIDSGFTTTKTEIQKQVCFAVALIQ